AAHLLGNRGRVAPAVLREERGPERAHLFRRADDERPLVQDVLPGEDDAAERRLPQRAPYRLAVSDVQRLAGSQLGMPTGAGEVRGRRGASRHRAPDLVERAQEAGLRRPQVGDLVLDVAELLLEPPPRDRLNTGGIATSQAQALLDPPQRDPERPR